MKKYSLTMDTSYTGVDRLEGIDARLKKIYQNVDAAISGPETVDDINYVMETVLRLPPSLNDTLTLNTDVLKMSIFQASRVKFVFSDKELIDIVFTLTETLYDSGITVTVPARSMQEYTRKFDFTPIERNK